MLKAGVPQWADILPLHEPWANGKLATICRPVLNRVAGQRPSGWHRVGPVALRTQADPELPFVSVSFRVSNLCAVTSLLGGKLQLPLNRLEARLLAQGVHKRVGL
jgi:hypothetical protein